MFKAYMLILFLSGNGDIVGRIDGGAGSDVVSCQKAVPMVIEKFKDQVPEGTTPFPVCINVEHIGEGPKL